MHSTEGKHTDEIVPIHMNKVQLIKVAMD